MKIITYDSLEVRTHCSREELGESAASLAAETIRAACASQGEARVIFASAPSQNEFLSALVRRPIVWSKVTVFHMSEFVGLRADHPNCFRHFLRAHLLDHIPEPHAVHLIQADQDPVHECTRYGKLLAEKPIDFVCVGIGENGHLAFNDPPVADFKDPQLVKIVELDVRSREQQVHDGCFARLDDVPSHAITLTVPALFGARQISGCAPGELKANAVHDTLVGPITKECPASILRRHPHAVLHIDTDSASHLTE